MDFKNNESIKRSDKVYKKLKELTESLNLNNFNGPLGYDALYIGKLLNISRSNTSRELNKLLKSGKAIKIKGKPVLYLDKLYFKENFSYCFTKSVFEDRKDFVNTLTNAGIMKKETFQINSHNQNKLINAKKISNKYSESILDNIIGAKSSLKEQVSKAKAAILYPPNGLHTLIIGPTGVGKSTFAEMMYKFGVEAKVFKSNSSFCSV